MSSQPRFLPNYSLDDYRQWEGRWELIDGIAVAMTPSPFGPHERIVTRLARFLGNQLETIGCNCEIYTGLDWIVSDHTVVRPDLMLVFGEQPEMHLQRAPDLVVEVLSDATRERDLVAKRALYREHGVREYWIVDPDSRTIEVCRGESALTVHEDDSLPLPASIFPESSSKLALAKIFSGT